MSSQPFFSKQTYISRRQSLKQQVGQGVILLLGNEESSANYKDNWYPFRQDSSFLYYAGISQAGLALIIDCSTGSEILFGDELSIDDIVWTGPLPTLAELAAAAGIQNVFPSKEITKYLKGEVLYLPPYRGEQTIAISSWLNKPLQQIQAGASVALIKAIAKQRSCKTAEELLELDKACTVTSRMHRAVMMGTKEGMYEYEAAAIAQKLMWDYHSQNAFLPIVTINGNVLHNHAHGNKLTSGKMLLFDSGTELPNGYCGDMTRTIPVDKTFTTKQREIYRIVYASYSKAVSLLQPGVKYRDIHLAACTVIADGLKQIGLMKGNVDEAVAAGAHAMFFQCGLGHMMGLDVHDMENLGEPYIGYTDELVKSTQFGLKSLRLGKALEEGYVLTVEPGIYIIPELIDSWRSKGLHTNFINYDLLETYKDFGGIRVEDDYTITATGSRLLGEPLGITLQEVEALRG